MGCYILQLAIVVSTLGGLVFGYELAIISGALPQLKTEFRLSCIQQEVLVSSLVIGALLASIVGGCIIDRHGRKKSILLSNVMVLTGSLILLLCSFPVLVFGRLVVGFALCISSMSCCIFVSEIVSPDHRGFLVTLYEAGITVGILLAYAVNYVLTDCRKGWRWMFGLAALPALLQLATIWVLPSSTEESLNQAQTDLINPMETAPESAGGSSQENCRVQYDIMYLFQRKDNMRTRVAVGLGLVLFQQFTGQPNILFYASTIFHSVGFKSNASSVLASVGLGLVKVIATLSAMVFSDRVGRRPLLISGCSVMALSLIIIGLLSEHSLLDTKRLCNSEDLNVNVTDVPHLTASNQSVSDTTFIGRPRCFPNSTKDTVFDNVKQKPLGPELSPSIDSSAVNWIILMCMMAVVSAYSVGFGPMTWLLLTEIFPAAVRGRAFAFANCFNWAANLLVTFSFLNVIGTIGLSGTFVIYGMTAVVAGIFFYFMLPETKGKSLQEIDMELQLNRIYSTEECCGCISPRDTFPRYQRVHCNVSTSG